MKKKVLCVFALITWLLLFSTLFSLWSEQAMVPEVILTQPKSQIGSTASTLPLDCMALDADGNSVIFQMIEGTGWEEGNRASLLEPSAYSLTPEEIEVQYSSGTIIRYATKTPRSGELVEPLSKRENRPDEWLVVGQEDALALKEGGAEIHGVSAKRNGAMLISVEQAPVPFLPGEAMSGLFEPNPFNVGQRNIYSLTELREFTSSLGLLALAPGLALFVFVLWGYSCALTKRPKRNWKKLAVNGGLSVAALLAVGLILHGVRLPSSLLPSRNIVDVGHYCGEFSEIFAALHTFAAEGNQIAATALSNAQIGLWASLAVALAGIVLGAVIVAVEIFVSRKKRLAPKHARMG